MAKKKGCIILIAVMLLTTLSSCRVYMDCTVNDDGTTTGQITRAFQQEEFNMLIEKDQVMYTKQTLEDGETYFVSPSVSQTVPTEQAARELGGVLTEDIFYYAYADSLQSRGMSLEQNDMEMSVTLSDEIAYTNADVETSGKTAVFSTHQDQDIWYAYTKAGKDAIEADSEEPEMKGAKAGKEYRKWPKNIRFTDNTGISAVVLNGQRITSMAVRGMVNGEMELVENEWRNSNGEEAFRNGKNTFRVTDLKGNISEFVIFIDRKAPVIKGVKNRGQYEGRAVIYIKDNMRLSQVVVNGKQQDIANKKTIKNGAYKGYYKFTLRQKGINKIVAKDDAGNRRTVTIKVAK